MADRAVDDVKAAGEQITTAACQLAERYGAEVVLEALAIGLGMLIRGRTGPRMEIELEIAGATKLIREGYAVMDEQLASGAGENG